MNWIMAISATVFLSACSVTTKREAGNASEEHSHIASEAKSAAAPAIAQAETAPSHGNGHASDHAPAANASAHHDAHPGVPASKALEWLTNGNARFVSKKLRRDGMSRADIKRLSSGQHPHAIVLSCSDSRVPPELLFDQKLGEIFTVRTAGQSLDHNVIGSIEYATEHLGAGLVVVMGHTACGAVKAAHGTLDGSSAGTASLDALVQDIHPRIMGFKGKEMTETVEKESWANAEGVAKDLLARSKLLAQKHATQNLMVVPALYDLKTGRVRFHDAIQDQLRTPATSHH